MEKMNTLPNKEIGEILLKASYVKEEGHTEGGFAGVFGQIAGEYFKRYGDQSDALAAISAKNHANGVHNPYAHMRRDLGFDFCRNPSEKNPFVAGPLKRSDCSLVSDGAAALVLSNEPLPGAKVPAVRWRSRTHVNEFLPLSRRDPTVFEGAALAWKKGLNDASMSLSDLHFVETHDCFTIAEMLEYEATRHFGRRHDKERKAPCQSFRRVEVSRPPNRSDRRVTTRDGSHATLWPSR
jgi:acetyl-CoA C-acetyltransferase